MQSAEMDFEQLVAEGEAQPTDGWDFSWFEGRATEERPPWGYAALLAAHLGRARHTLDLQTGGGEVLAWALGQSSRIPATAVATEGWPPNAAIACQRLGELGGYVVAAENEGPLPFAPGCFDLVSTRHPVTVVWEEVARVLHPGGFFVSQMVGAMTNKELYEFFMGPQSEDLSRSPEVAVSAAEACGLQLVDLRQATLEVCFFDVGAVVHFLLKVPWTVPGFTADAYLDRLEAMHENIARWQVLIAFAALPDQAGEDLAAASRSSRNAHHASEEADANRRTVPSGSSRSASASTVHSACMVSISAWTSQNSVPS